jgi:transcriptional regulator with XRE-family HTH domain
MPNPTEIANKIKLRRKSLSLTQAQLASKVGLSRAAISQFESGDSNPSVETLVKIANALGTHLSALISDTNQKPEEKLFTIDFPDEVAFVNLPYVPFRLRSSIIELGESIQHPDNFETLRLYVSNEEEAARYNGALVFEVEGDSMEPLLRSGDKVIAWQVPEGKWEQVYNQVCVVAYDDTVTIKAVRENELFTRNLLTLYAQNPAAGFLPVQRQQIQSVWRVEEFFDRPKIRL